MFSQFRNALEQVTQQLETPENGSRPSLDGLRKSLGPQRQGSTEAVPKSTTTSPPAAGNARKTTLEERLRRAAQASAAAAADNTSAKPATRHRTDSTSSQKAGTSVTTKSTPSTPPSRVNSPAPRGRTTEPSRAVLSRTSSPAPGKPPSTTSRTASPAPATRIGSRPPSRAGSPAPGVGSKSASASTMATAARTASRPPSRAASPAPVARTGSRPPSRASSPVSAPRTRAAELSGKTGRAASPSPLRGSAVGGAGLRRGSIAADKTLLGAKEDKKDEERAEENETTKKGDAVEDDMKESASDELEKDEEKEPDAAKDDVGDQPTLGGIAKEDDDLAVEDTHVSAEENRVEVASHPPEEPITQHFEPASSKKDNSEDAETSALPDPSPKTPISPIARSTADEKPTSPNLPSEDTNVSDLANGSSVQRIGSPLRVAEDTPASVGTQPPVSDEPIETHIEADKIPLPNSPQHLSEAPTSASLSTRIQESPASPEITSPKSALPPKSPVPVASSSPAVAEMPQTSGTPTVDRSAEVESLQARLKEIEQRFTDVSTSFKKLQAEKLAADAVLREHTPLDGIQDSEAIKDFFANLKTRDEVFQEEIKRLTGKLEVQDERMEDLRETHQLESHSLTEELKKLRNQLAETEALFEAAQRATAKVESSSDALKGDISGLEKELENTKALAKEEEEKRVKAISLLKTVRQKLVKAEKEREDALRDVGLLREKVQGDRERESMERETVRREVEGVRSKCEQDVAGLKAQYEREIAAVRQRYEQELSAVRGQNELDLNAVKTSYSKEINTKSTRISTLENSLNSVTRDKNAFFDQLQLRQAEGESAQTHLDSLQHQNTELEFQLREANDRLALQREEYADLQREIETRTREGSTSPDEIVRLVAAAEAKYEVKLGELRRNLEMSEKERHESEVEWSRKLKEKVKELDDLKGMLGNVRRSRESEEHTAVGLKEELEKEREVNKKLTREVGEVEVLREQVVDLERSLREGEEEMRVRVSVLEKTVEEHRAREGQLKQSNKTLRDELRKVQSSAALLERQRNPGVGYWTTRTSDASTSSPTLTQSNGGIASPRPSVSGPPDTPRTGSPAPSATGSNKDKEEEEVNLEYLRNVIFQFLEHKEMRPHLVKVLSVILHFTPQETRKLISKV